MTPFQKLVAAHKACEEATFAGLAAVDHAERSLHDKATGTTVYVTVSANPRNPHIEVTARAGVILHLTGEQARAIARMLVEVVGLPAERPEDTAALAD